MATAWTQLVLATELHRSQLGHLFAACDHAAQGRADLVLRLSRAWLEPGLRELVLREAELGALLRSPFVVAHRAVAQDRDRPFSVMTRVDGLSLEDLLSHAPRRALRLLVSAVIDAADGLAALHALADDHGPLDVVHQAPVARHILVGVDGVARLTDLTQAVSRLHPWMPQIAERLRPHELAPEQIATPARVDGRCDVYLLASTLWRSLTGRTVDQTRSEGAEGDPQPLPTLAELGVTASAELEQLLEWSLLTDRDARLPSAQVFADALRGAAVSSGLIATREEVGAYVRLVRAERAARTHEAAVAAHVDGPGPEHSPPAAGRQRPFNSTYAVHKASTPPRRNYWFARYRDEPVPRATPATSAPEPVPSRTATVPPELASNARPDWFEDPARTGAPPWPLVAPAWSSNPTPSSPPAGRALSFGWPLTVRGAVGSIAAVVLLGAGLGWLATAPWAEPATLRAGAAPGVADQAAGDAAAGSVEVRRPGAASPAVGAGAPASSSALPGAALRSTPAARPPQAARALPRAVAGGPPLRRARPGASAASGAPPPVRTPAKPRDPAGVATPTLTLGDFLLPPRPPAGAGGARPSARD